MKKSYIVGLFCLGVLGLAYNNCSKVTVDSVDTSGTPGITTQTIIDTIKNCDDAEAQGLLKSSVQNISFADTKVESGPEKANNVCQFKRQVGDRQDNTPDANGNYTMVNDHLRARYEQKVALNIPANSIICGAEVSAKKQAFYYDDVFYFSLNNVILASSLKSSLAKTTTQDFSYQGKNFKLYDYNWSKFADSNFCHLSTSCNDPSEKANFTLGPDDYCAGKEAGSGDCFWPKTQENGYIKLGFDPEVIVPVSLGSKDGKQTLMLAVTGDNDPEIDCYHEAIDMDLKLYYYTKPSN